uniref:Uncharacterized protein n=1 Tax=Arundo donax TaxID=35708 RepID=A0A0A8YB92_ARUDO
MPAPPTTLGTALDSWSLR